MARRGSHQKPHYRRSKSGKIFRAGRGKRKYSFINYSVQYSRSTPKTIIKKQTKIIKTPKKIEPVLARDIFISSMAVAISTATANPLPILAWRVYKSGEFIEKIIQKINDKKIDDYLQVPIELGKSKISPYVNPIIDQTSKAISTSFTDSGFNYEISRRTTLDVNTIENVIENTVKNALQEGWDNLPSLVGVI